MEGYIIPECNFDTVLVKAILHDKVIVNHKKGCNNVVKVMKDGKLKDQFAIGIVDRDKKDLDYLKEFEEYKQHNLNLYKHRSKPHFMIQLDPPLERWILLVAKEAGLNVEDFGLPSDIGELKKLTKSDLADETEELWRFCYALLNSKSLTIGRFAKWIKYFKKERYKSDINVLLNG